MQALDGDATHRDDIAIVYGDVRPLNAVFLAAHDLEAGNFSGHGIVAPRVVVVLVGSKNFADGHALFARRFQHLDNRTRGSNVVVAFDLPEATIVCILTRVCDFIKVRCGYINVY